MSNSVDTDHMPHYVASDLCLHCLLDPVCLITLVEYVIHERFDIV